MSGAKLGQPVPPPPSHCSGSHRSRSVSRAPSGVSVRQSPRPPAVPPSVLEGEGESVCQSPRPPAAPPLVPEGEGESVP